MSRQEIGAHLFISPWTVKVQLDHLRQRIQARNTPQAIAICIARGYLCVDGRNDRVFIPEPLALEAA